MLHTNLFVLKPQNIVRKEDTFSPDGKMVTIMQKKNNLDAMAQKYKEEMMRIYNRSRVSETAATEAAKSETAATVFTAAPVSVSDKSAAYPYRASESGAENTVNADKADIPENTEKPCVSEADKSRLMRPPMPNIPRGAETRERENNRRSPNDPPMPKIPPQMGGNSETVKSKFPTAEELIRLDSESSAPEAAEQPRDARFEPAPRDGHNQGNYDFSVFPDDEYKKEIENFGGYEDDELFFAAQGYLQVEVSAENGEPIDSAAIVVTERAGDTDTLVVTLVTGSDGKTEVIALPIPHNAERNGKMQGDYMITVYKEGYYTVYNLPVPIFDTIKSIQPVTVAAAEK